jgi:hypothetical protein
MTWVLAVAMKSVFGLILFGLICLPARLAVQKYMPDGRLKRLLLTRISSEKPPGYRRWGGTDPE